MQKKYLEQIDDLYGEDFNVVKMPLLVEEVRGTDSIRSFSKMLVEPYQAPA
jgi:arsenite-transporting ATPase